VELIKADLRGEKGEERKRTAQAVLLSVLKDSLKLLHPLMPFITEEIWSVLPQETEVRSIMQQPFPEAGADYPDAEKDMTCIMDVIRALRNVRSEMNIPPALNIEAVCYSNEESVRKLLESGRGYINMLARLSSLKVSAPAGRPENAATAIAGGVEIFVPLEGLINFEEEKRKLEKEREKVIKEIEAVQKKLSNEDFLARAPKEVIEKDRARVEEFLQKKSKLEEGLARIKGR